MIAKFIETTIDILIVLGALSPLFYQGLKWLQAKTTDKRVQVLESYAMRVVQAMEQYSNLAGGDKKKEALNRLAGYIAESPLKFNVTADQMNDLIESAVNKLHDQQTAGTKVEGTIYNDAMAIQNDVLQQVHSTAVATSETSESLQTSLLTNEEVAGVFSASSSASASEAAN